MSAPDAASRVPLFLILPSGEPGELVGEELARLDIGVFRSVADFLEDPAADGSGCLLIAPDVEGADVRTLLTGLVDRPGPWSPVILDWLDAENGPGRRTLRAYPVSVGYAEPFDRLRQRLEAPVAEEGRPFAILELRTLLSEVSRTRHDINNPLTAAMAETQLLLMDVEEGEVRSGLETVERQLRRIRDLVARLASVRAPVVRPPKDFVRRD